MDEEVRLGSFQHVHNGRSAAEELQSAVTGGNMMPELETGTEEEPLRASPSRRSKRFLRFRALGTFSSAIVWRARALSRGDVPCPARPNSRNRRFWRGFAHPSR
jgi:hypothetical protein